jgi:RNA polymerase sigma factor (sigma-70 family)
MMSLVTVGLVAATLFLLLRVLGAIAADEVKGWLPHLGRKLLGSAARRVPAHERARWNEEWLAEHAARIDRPLTALTFAIRVRVRARATARELGPETISSVADTERARDDTDLSWIATAGSQQKALFREALENLTYRERRVLELRYGLGGEHRRTYDEIGRTFNVTTERIREIERLSLMKLQSVAEAQKLRDVA